MKILQIFENQAPASQPNICTEHSSTYVNLVLQTAEKVVYAMRAHNAMSTYKHIVLMTFTAAVWLSHYHRKQSVWQRHSTTELLWRELWNQQTATKEWKAGDNWCQINCKFTWQPAERNRYTGQHKPKLNLIYVVEITMHEDSICSVCVWNDVINSYIIASNKVSSCRSRCCGKSAWCQTAQSQMNMSGMCVTVCVQNNSEYIHMHYTILKTS